jgi:hypothetical protein
MSHIRWTCIAVLCGLVIVGVGCRSKESGTKPDSKTNEGPVLAPPQKPNAPEPTKGAEDSPPTEGEPEGKLAASARVGATAATTQPPQPTEGDPAAKSKSSDAAQTAAGETAEAAKIRANLASLSSADRALAEKQKVCPVSNEPLGAMGPPKKITVAGRDVFICCPSCEEPVTHEPAKYLAKVGLQPAN